MLLAVLALGGVAYGAVWILVEPWSTRVFQGAFWLALLALLHGLRLLSALRRALPVILLMGPDLPLRAGRRPGTVPGTLRLLANRALRLGRD